MFFPCFLLTLPEHLRGMGAWRKTMELQKLDNSTLGIEIGSHIGMEPPKSEQCEESRAGPYRMR